MLIKPAKLKQGDTVAIVSLSSGMGGESVFRYRYEIGKMRLETEFGLTVISMPNALKGIEFLYKNPQARASDLMQAFLDDRVSAVFSMIGGDDTIRILNHIDFNVIAANPKVFIGYSDTTVNHFMMYKAGLVSFYGPSILAEFAENVAMHDYTKDYLRRVLFTPTAELRVEPSRQWTSEYLEWADASNSTTARRMTEDVRGFELLQGSGLARGRLLGGCVDVFPMLIGTAIWPSAAEWADKLLFLETSEDCPHPATLKYILRGLAAQGVIGNINGILFGKPLGEKYYEEYKQVLVQVIGDECRRPELPILYNMNFGHTAPMCVLPYGIMAEIDCVNRSFRFLEPGVI